MDKSRERAILNCVFSEDDFQEVIPREKPDFECIVTGDHSFGVEVTQLFVSESAARSFLIPDYLDEIVFHGKYRHKDDRSNLKVQDAVYTARETGESFPCKVIRQQQRTTLDFCNDLTDAILTKNEKAREYSTSISDLILFDADNTFGEYDIDSMLEYMLVNDSRKAILKSPFREIYLLTREYRSRKLTYYAIRATAFASEVMSFRSLFDEYHSTKTDRITIGNFLSALGHHLKETFPSIEFGFDNRKQLCFLWAGIACSFGDKCRLEIADVSLANMTGQLVSDEMVTKMSKGFQDFLGEKRHRNRLTAFIQFPARAAID